MPNDIPQKLDLIIAEQGNLRTLINRVEVNLLDEVKAVKKEVKAVKDEVKAVKKEVAQNTKGINKIHKVTDNHEERISSLETKFQPIAV